jgi:L,D-transpeptidase catalytic domain
MPVNDRPIVPGKASVFFNLPADPANSVSSKSSLLYEELCLGEKGLSKEAFDYAYKGYAHLIEKKIISQPDYLTICDLSQSIRQKRFYLIDITNNKVILNTYVAHGRKSGGEYARKFSNGLKSLQSSLGFYITKNTYVGENGLSLRLEGLEPGFNDKAYRRAVVVHGASYVGQGLAGRSFGCPAVPKKESKLIINTIKNGTCFFVYHPEKKYLQTSRILND